MKNEKLLSKMLRNMNDSHEVVLTEEYWTKSNR